VSFSFGNVAEVLCAAVALTASGNLPFDLSRPKQLVRFLVFAVLLAPLASLFITEGSQLLRGTTFNKQTLWLIYRANALGIAILTPMMLAIQKEELFDLFRRKKLPETIAILIGVLLLSIAVFEQRTVSLVYLLFPAMLFVLFRLRRSGAAIAIFLIALLAIYFTTHHSNFFFLEQAHSVISATLLLQIFLATMLLTIHAVSAVLAERDRLYQEIKNAYREALGSAAIDHLTGVANRRTFEREFLREWNRAARERGSLSLLMIDIDHFKNYNDHYGHVAGDHCLRSVASLLSQSMMRSSDLLARYGGEEFAIILPGARTESATAIATHLRDTLLEAKLPHVACETGIVTLSIGIATFDVEKEKDAIALIQAADQALYRAKQSGRNQVAITTLNS
jgi:diguanylate cyclase (GGDEF)-like protein